MARAVLIYSNIDDQYDITRVIRESKFVVLKH